MVIGLEKSSKCESVIAIAFSRRISLLNSSAHASACKLLQGQLQLPCFKRPCTYHLPYYLELVPNAAAHLVFILPELSLTTLLLCLLSWLPLTACIQFNSLVLPLSAAKVTAPSYCQVMVKPSVLPQPLHSSAFCVLHRHSLFPIDLYNRLVHLNN